MRKAVSLSLHSHVYGGRPSFISPRQKHKDAICYARNPFLCTIRSRNRVLQRTCHPEFIKANVCYGWYLPTACLKINEWKRQKVHRLVNWFWTSIHSLSVVCSRSQQWRNHASGSSNTSSMSDNSFLRLHAVVAVFKALFTSCCLPTCFSLVFKNCLRVQHQLKNRRFIFKKTQLKRFINVMLKHVDESLGMGCSASHKPLSFSNARKLKMMIK